MTKMRKMGGDISRINLQGMLLDRLDFSNSKMVQANLRKAVLRDTCLNNVNLQEAQLQEADLRRATFIASDLREANLSNASLVNANFRKARLNGADLRGSNLAGADLDWADLQGAKLDGATGYTAEQLSKAYSLHNATGLDAETVATLNIIALRLFEIPSIQSEPTDMSADPIILARLGLLGRLSAWLRGKLTR